MQMSFTEISDARLISQKINDPEDSNAKDIVSWMGAMQAQDFAMAKWAIGVRLKGSTDKSIQASLDKGEILRIHLLRPTWHFVASDDIYWMLQLSAYKIKSSLKTRHKELELSEPVHNKTRTIIERMLSGGESLTRDELATEFLKAGIRTDENRLSHILFRAEMDGIVCSGPLKEKKLTYSLLEERVPQKRELSREEALAELAKRYFQSRCPATIQDFIWWSNLSKSDAKRAVDLSKQYFITESFNSVEYLIPTNFPGSFGKNNSVHLLPAFDEFLIGYRDRSSSLSMVHNKKAISNNGIFYPVIVVNGQVSGVWKRTVKGNNAVIQTDFFISPDKLINRIVEKEADMYGQFLEKKVELNNNPE
jgi:hypothetical protein